MTLSEFSAIVRKAREQKGMSQDQLAVAADLSPQFMKKLEDGESTGQIARALKVLETLGVTVTLQPPNAG